MAIVLFVSKQVTDKKVKSNYVYATSLFTESIHIGVNKSTRYATDPFDGRYFGKNV